MTNYDSFSCTESPCHGEIMEKIFAYKDRQSKPFSPKSNASLSTLNQLVAFSNLFYEALRTVYLFCFSVNKEGTLLDITENIEKILGFTPEGVIGKEALSFIHEKDYRKAHMLSHITTVNKKSFCSRIRIKKKDGDYLTVKIFTVPMELSQENSKIYLMGVPLPCKV